MKRFILLFSILFVLLATIAAVVIVGLSPHETETASGPVTQTESSSENEDAPQDNKEEATPSEKDPVEEPADKDEEPADKDEEPADKDEEPADKDEDPADKDEDPADKDEKPADKDEEPADKDEKPADKDEKPADKDEDPADKPSSGTQKPSSGTQKPSSGTQTNPQTHTHSFTVTSTAKATCTKDGKTVLLCSCGAQKTETTSKLGHNMGSWKVTKQATASATGTRERTCTRCSHKETETIPKTAVSTATPAECLEVFRLCNEERKKAGLSPFTYYYPGQGAANLRATEAESYFSHTRPDGRDCFSVWDDLHLGDFMGGENLAQGQTSAAQVVKDWMNSEGHRANILRAEANALVVARVGNTWVQLFIII